MQARRWQTYIALHPMLHPKDGLSLGIPSDPCYVDTRRFLDETLDYLGGVNKGNSPFFAYDGLDQFEMVKIGGGPA